jgi:hypothetical protein
MKGAMGSRTWTVIAVHIEFLSMSRRGIGEDYFSFFHDVFPLFASGGGDASGRGRALGGIIGTRFV